ncbi:hypothetical protein, unlikely [Trypanosoma congolense IL3000]|uniref:Uncharacterized protein n=1 Tax=Trypanosoma congolense (strain IL3000) TaxID=1068625 RepID=F9WDG2_TRYCI|nr:hypothetical protein, unlikely [Trypanosoma congolense IL3000]
MDGSGRTGTLLVSLRTEYGPALWAWGARVLCGTPSVPQPTRHDITRIASLPLEGFRRAGTGVMLAPAVLFLTTCRLIRSGDFSSRKNHSRSLTFYRKFNLE